MEIVERAAFRSRATATRRSPTTPTTCSKRSSPSCGSAASAPSCASRCRARCRAAMLAPARGAAEVGTDQVYPIHGMLDLADVGQLYDARPARPEGRALGAVHPAPPRDDRRTRTCSPRSPPRHRRPAPVRLVRDERRGLRAAPPRTTRTSSTLKTTVYRTSHDSALAPALIEASENGKQSVCVVELKARFDEQRNIEWARALEQAGVHVVYGFPDMKIHAKTTLVVRREGDGLRRYVHIGTGNYHATTARIYEDVGLFTADPDIAADVADLFNFVTGFGRPQRFRKLLVAPFNLRKRARRAHPRRSPRPPPAGKHARIRIKCNNLTDPAMIEELYRASQAGAEIDVIVRAICTLRAGRPGAQRADPRALDPRPLPRAQPALLLRGRRGKTYLLGSADLMARNLDHRIEVVVPVEDAARARRDRVDLQGAARRQLAGVEARRRRHVGAGAAPRRPSAGGRPRRRSCGAAHGRAGSHRHAAEARRHVASSSWRVVGRHRRGVEHRPPARDPGRATILLASARCSGSAPSSSAAARSRRRSSPRPPSCVAGYVDGARAVAASAARGADREPGAPGDERRGAARAARPASACPSRLLRAAEEGRLAFVGAVGAARRPRAGWSPSSTSVAGRRRSRRHATRRAALVALDRHRRACG